MAIYTQQDRVYLRMAMGFSATYRQADPRLENAITATLSQADGGSLPDNTTQLFVLSLIYGQAAVTGPPAIPAKQGILSIRAALDTPLGFLGATSVDKGEVAINSPMQMALLRREGRALCNQLANVLGAIGVRADMFGNPAVILVEDPFTAQPLINW